jgi:TetR/AcrR family transcriptional regulator, transcriptional repressor for nem operon
MSKLTTKGARTRERIVAAAAELMWEHGVAGTTVDDVRACAGVSSSQVYHYFADKDSLARAVIDHQNETVVGSQEPLLAGLDTMEGVQAWRDAVIANVRRFGGRGGCPIASLGSELAEVDANARAAVADAFERWERGIRGGLRAMADRGGLPADADPDRLARGILATLQGGLLLAQMQRDSAPVEAAFELIVGHLTLLGALADK